MSARIGAQMAYLAASVRDGESICSLVDRAYRTARGYPSRKYGYEVVHRAIRAGLIRAEYRISGPGGARLGRYYLFTP